jgi:hypothetical protein
VTDDECIDTRFCQGLVAEPFPTDTTFELGLCLERVRVCTDTEVCNGLDDDCNGAIDDGCTEVPLCVDEDRCEAFSCQVVADEPSPQCLARPATASRRFFEPCTDGSQCRNGICNAGFCSPLCAEGFDPLELPCPAGIDIGDQRAVPTVCAEQALGAEFPAHNACQVLCADDSACFGGTRCVWRRIVPSIARHESVCALPDPDRLPDGEACANNQTLDGDASCQSGLCFGQVCTRLCGGPGADCSDIGPDFVCQPRRLFYTEPNASTLEFRLPVCVRREG